MALFLYTVFVNAQITDNFTGVWQLDINASDSIDAILKAQGKSKIERVAAKNMVVTQQIKHTENILSVHFKSRAVDDTQDFIINGMWTTMDTPRMGRIQTKTFWMKRLRSIATVMKITANGHPATMTINRTLKENSRIMELKIRLLLENGEEYFARRIFNKI